jgi:tetratricopeptide (TPR) repeat protein
MDISRILEHAHQKMKVGRYEEAPALYDQVIGTDTSNLSALENKGRAYYYLGRHEDAIVWYDLGTRGHPVNASVLFEKGYTLRKMERYEDAIKSFDQVLAVDHDPFLP